MNKHTFVKDIRMTIEVEDDRKGREVWEEMWDKVLKWSLNSCANQMCFMCENKMGVHADIRLEEIVHENQT